MAALIDDRLNPLLTHPQVQQWLEAMRSSGHIPSQGLLRAARLPLAALLNRELQVPVVFLTDRTDHAISQLDELGYWAPNSRRLLFAEPNPLYYEPAAWGNAARRDRLAVLTTLAQYHLPNPVDQQPPLIVAPLRAVMTRTLPRRDFLKSARQLRLGQTFQMDNLVNSWLDCGYQPSEAVVEPGQFSRRGGLLDIWAPAMPQPARLEFFGDEIDTLRKFDPAPQRKVAPLETLLITPAREVLPGKAAERSIDLNDLEEFLLPVVHPAVASLFDYLPRNAVIILDDLSLISSLASDIEEQAVRMRSDAIREETLDPEFPIPYLTWSEISDSFAMHQWVDLGYAPDIDSSPLAAIFQPGGRYGGRLKPLMDDIAEGLQNNHAYLIVSRQKSRLEELWAERGSNRISDALTFSEGSLAEGFTLTLANQPVWHVLTDSEIFGWERPQARQRARQTAETPEASYADLHPGDWVVHIDFGVGRYTGLVSRTLEGIQREFLSVEYEGGDQLFDPIHQADRLTRYIGPDGEPPSPTRLGTAEWSQARARVNTSVQEVARDMLELYAARHTATGYKFSPDSAWQMELEASFPYIETPDQLQAIGEVKQDMETPRPMDRLLCGDVGYGKTEVALRAAFKPVMDGKQVAVLVPTTVLAQQHYETFRQRLAAFPVTVEMLSRFRSAREQDAIIQKLLSGEVDIVIGTHRLIQSDVVFKDLGLLIIDEEQRFGVTHKEFFKRMRTELDVLTLTATPIPRTLYMALTGVRDISIINTPPAERLPIVTHIGPYSPKLVRQAILRELERGGQVFFVHNRVQTIRAMESHLHQLVPEARGGIAHGQMHENELAEVMTRFNHGDVDVLLCTSIIESGLDIPNANTLIVDRGDTFGLAQLYQLRGRVGRGAQRAYAYFFRHRKRTPTLEGQERLEVIAENTQLGAGYSIAMRDLEMRGAGEMLGTRQSGMIAAVGFHLYTRLLAQAVQQVRQATGLPIGGAGLSAAGSGAIPVSVDLPMHIGIPLDYVPDQTMRLRLYRRIADIRDEAGIDALADEFADRFGVLPAEVTNLLYQLRVRIRAEAAGLASVTVEGDQLVLRFPPLPDGVSHRKLPTITGLRSGKNAYWMMMDESDGWSTRLLDVLSDIINACKPF